MNIIKATYGGRNCTEVIKKQVKGDSLIIRSDNSIIGDPKVGTRKDLIINIDGIEYITPEGILFVYPKDKHERLGIFYSNNNNPKIYPAIISSLISIKKAAEGKADILTCMWKHEEMNPFPEYIAWTQTSSHLNQLLQIMQLLYTAREIHDYKYVSFLEHDVLYGEGYFDYPEIHPGEVLTNMNYIGMNKDGFQALSQKDEPFHQMTMRFDEAISHCESILANALITNSGLIEPQPPKVIRKKWNAPNSSVHINHGYHFTSHFNVYSKTAVGKIHPYWGDHSKYLNLFI
jgi:hypothetical protein